MSSPFTQRYSSGNINGNSRRAISALISRNASAPREAGTAHSISLKRTDRTVDSIDQLASTCSLCDSIDAQKRLSGGHHAGTALPMSHSSPNAVFSSSTSLTQRPKPIWSTGASVVFHFLVSTDSVCGNQ